MSTSSTRWLIYLVAHLPLFLLSNGIAQTEVKTKLPTSKKDRVAAIGETAFHPELEKKIFADSKSFEAKRPPAQSDWLANHRENGQTFDQFLLGRRNLFQPPRTVIYIQPLGDFPGTEREVLHQVSNYAQRFFSAKVKLQPVHRPPKNDSPIKSRHHPVSHQEQYLSTDILKWLSQDMPADAYARIAVTMTDLYPDPSWNFVFGQASLFNRTGVYSFARYGEPGTELFLRRCLRVFSHETGHMFAFYHCIHYQCLMNGANHLEESDATPLHLCPICLRKLHTANRFDPIARYQSLSDFYRENGLSKEQEWVSQRLQALKTP